MEYLIQDDNGFMRRKYSNETMRNLSNFINKQKLKFDSKSYNEILGETDIFLSSKRLRTEQEIIVDRQAYKENI